MVAALGFNWLVGECEHRSGEVVVNPGQVRTQKSLVYVKKCRYLESSGCVGMCINMCKVGGSALGEEGVSTYVHMYMCMAQAL
jgi:hypothetical protein